MAASQDKRKIFESSLLKFLQKWNFDGVQIAWQYPVCKEVKYFYFDKLTILTTDLIINTLHNVPTFFLIQAPCTRRDTSDKDSFSILLVELSKILRKHNLEFSAIVAPNPEVATIAYEPKVLMATLDWIAIAANDYYETDSKRTAYLLPLKTNESQKTNSFVSRR